MVHLYMDKRLMNPRLHPSNPDLRATTRYVVHVSSELFGRITALAVEL